ncbi:hypothetical protein B4U84_29640 [Westiellopsis prolifica IICB1]|nr:hypothetical protein B4U84_29640 [Westiellopsis prolifica IICB1]
MLLSLQIATEYTQQDTLIEENTVPTNQAITQTTSPITNSLSTIKEYEFSDACATEVDISDIPKISFKRKPTSVPLLPEFQEYSVQNAILILMRRRPDLNMHIDAITRDTYGDLPEKQFQTAKMNVSKALSTGVAQVMWFRVLRANGVYTLHYEKGVTASTPKRK